MSSEAFIERICNLPVEFRRGSKSPVQLIRESGYFESPNELTVEALAAFICNHVEVIQVWLSWSEDKRVSSGWYFIRKNGGFIVGNLADGPQLRFSDESQACAEFVLREVASIASHTASL